MARRLLPLFVSLGIVALVWTARAQMPQQVHMLPYVARDPTLTPSITPSPTTAPTATATATVAPTSAPTGVVVLNNHSVYTSSTGSLHVVGEVYNGTNRAIDFVRVSVNLFYGAQLVATDYSYTPLDDVLPGSHTCFDILITNPPAYTNYVFEPPTYSSSTATALALTPIGESGSIDSSGDYHILGQVRNDTGRQVDFVQAVGTLYNAGGTVLDCDYDFVNSTNLTPGQTSAFDIEFFSRSSYADVASWQLQIGGNPK